MQVVDHLEVCFKIDHHCGTDFGHVEIDHEAAHSEVEHDMGHQKIDQDMDCFEIDQRFDYTFPVGNQMDLSSYCRLVQYTSSQ